MIRPRRLAMPKKNMINIFKEHLPYEIDMMRKTYTELESLVRGPAGPETVEAKVRRFALIESFCIHCRSLLDFFSGTTKQNDATVLDFTVGFKTKIDQTVEPVKSLRAKINKQI